MLSAARCSRCSSSAALSQLQLLQSCSLVDVALQRWKGSKEPTTAVIAAHASGLRRAVYRRTATASSVLRPLAPYFPTDAAGTYPEHVLRKGAQPASGFRSG